MRTIKVECHPGLLPVVTITEPDGEPVRIVCDAVGVRHLGAAEIPVVSLQVTGDLTIEADVIVEMPRDGGDADVREVIDGFLGGLDPEEIDRLAMAGSDPSERPIVGVFRVLRQIAAGEVPST